MFGFLQPAPALERLPAGRIEPTYQRLRYEHQRAGSGGRLVRWQSIGEQVGYRRSARPMRVERRTASKAVRLV